jgi:RNA 3'-terminal phosphate cyclase-like protein
MTNRMIEAAKGILLKYIPDVFILTDHRKGPASGLSPGFGITLTAETINGTFNRTIELRFILLNITLFLI